MGEPARTVGFGNQAASAREIPEEPGSDGARVQVRTTGPGQKRDYENGFRKNGIRKKRDSAFKPIGPARQKLDHLCLCSAVATPELQARVCMPRVDVPDLFLFVAKMAIICRKMWKK
jgi:hypothetical protein